MPKPGLFGDSFAFDVNIDDTTKLPVLANVEAGFVKGLTNKLLSNIDGGASGSVGAAHTTGFVLEQWLGATIRNAVNGDTKIRLNAWGQPAL